MFQVAAARRTTTLASTTDTDWIGIYKKGDCAEPDLWQDSNGVTPSIANRVVDQLQGFAQPGALILRQGHLVVLAHMLYPLPLPHVSADIDDFADARDRGGVGYAVEAFDHLGPGGAQAEHAAPI